ncbi:uncharacterized protein LOC110708895 [Chenopodium quinoa]|uniref:uncharacterized protein LOC110708895 n=1 Tax=Chenopodium quinoa TaxID=63459 RepID=UPI000B774725|nr:uncharacterized protein LOC110708895 [Chenopodium quinoa]
MAEENPKNQEERSPSKTPSPQPINQEIPLVLLQTTSEPKNTKPKALEETATSSTGSLPSVLDRIGLWKKRKAEKSGKSLEVQILEIDMMAKDEGPEEGKENSEGEEDEKALGKQAERYVVGYRIDDAWCSKVNFEFLDLLKFQGWDVMFTVKAKNYLYPLAIDEFCKECEFEDGVCYSKVNGVDVEFDAARLGSILQVPCEGFDVYMKGVVTVKVAGHTKTEIINYLGGKKGVSVMNHNDLSPLHKLLFNLVKKSLVPRTQKKNELCYLDMALIFCMSKKIKINFPALMIQHLEHCIEKEIKVGYAAILASVFENLGVQLRDFYGHMREKGENVINETTLRGLSLAVVRGKCVRYEVAQKKKEKEEDSQLRVPVRKSRRLSVGTQAKTSVVDPLELSEGKMKAMERTDVTQAKEFHKAISSLEAKLKKAQDDNKADLEKILKALDA